MKSAGIISIGNELLSGVSLDTNSSWISRQLLSVGIPTISIFTVGDDVKIISDTIKQALNKADIVLITGGLGPTDDDLTRHAIADVLGVELKLNDELLSQISEFFKRRNIRMAKTNNIQAYLPESATALANPVGTASGIMADYKNKMIVAMPGPPTEMMPMFKELVLPKIEKYGHGQVVLTQRMKCFGTGESVIAEKLGDVMARGKNPLVNCTVSGGIITLHIVAAAKTKEQAEDMIAGEKNRICGILGDIVYSKEEKTLAEVVAQELLKRGKTISLAESCTGGLLAKMLTDVPGATGYFTYGWVTYSNEAKISQLGVNGDTIDKYGAVSEQVALEMAIGARQRSGSDISISITGIAGPGGGTEQKPVGLVYIVIYNGGAKKIHKFVFPHSREYVRQRTVLTALNLLRLEFKD
ncbi:MAG: competence/damage-inducible protein A [Sedimentisphaerales bacterium]|nr:competence/damage-inducible protein A [Sedimentisphaerales bacterium]